jgi:hypothetical protein
LFIIGAFDIVEIGMAWPGFGFELQPKGAQRQIDPVSAKFSIALQVFSGVPAW